MKKSRICVNTIVDIISKEIGISRGAVRLIVTQLLELIEENTCKNEKTTLRGFGTFYLKRRKPRRYKNRKTGEIKLSDASPIPAFRPSKVLLEAFTSIIVDRNVSLKDLPNGVLPPLKKKQTHTSSLIENNDTIVEVKSTPNKKQTDDLRIGYIPDSTLESWNFYPIVSMPKENALLKLPRNGRSNIKGYKEDDFINAITNSALNISISDNMHLSVPYRRQPYEPDIVLSDDQIGLYVDIEIDEPYDGCSRISTHTIEGNDDIRNIFFKESGWVVVRFTEKQVHQNCESCIQFLKFLLERLRRNCKDTRNINIEHESRWNRAQSVIWERELYREKYLGILSFNKQKRGIRILCSNSESEEIEQSITRSPVPYIPQISTSEKTVPKAKHLVGPDIHKKIEPSLNHIYPPKLRFDDGRHIYAPKEDKTGNSDHISVTTLIDQFFPYFDTEAYIERKIAETGKSRKEIEEELKQPADRGTYMHEQIEHFLKGEKYDSELEEFKLFMDFYNEQVQPKGLVFDSAEFPIELPEYNIAGTVDALFRKPNGEYVMIDWKRSTHLIIDGYAKKFGYGRGLSVLSHLDNSSYYKYELQQSFYKYILEEKYNIKVSSMILAVLHPEYDRYYTIKLSEYRKQEVLDMIESYENIK